MAESERRYRSLTEQSSDAILIIQDDELVFYNQRLIDLTGRPRSWFESVEDLIATVHPDDRDEVRATPSSLAGYVGWRPTRRTPASDCRRGSSAL